MNKVNIDWLILHMVDLYQNKTINTLIVSALRSQQVQVELEDSINITYGILDNIFQILGTENVPVTQIIPCLAILLKKKNWKCYLQHCQKVTSARSQVPRSRNFFRFYSFIEFISWLLRKWGSACDIWARVLNLWLDRCLLGPSGQNLVSRPQTPSSKYFLQLCNFIGFISWLLKRWGAVCEYWS